MPLFPVLDIETKVQEKDKTRLDASKSFASGGAEISSMTITPSALDSAVTVTDDDYMLDWQYDFKVDVVTGFNDKLNFKEGSGAELTATLTQGSYTLTLLAAEIQTRMRAVGALTHVVGVTDDDEFTFQAESGFQLLGETGTDSTTSILAHIGFTEDETGKASYTGDEVETVQKKVTVTIVDTEQDPDETKTLSKTLLIVSERADRLFATDDMLRQKESDILRYVVDGRATFKDVHRRAQKEIMEWLDTQGFVDDFEDKFTVRRIRDTDEVAAWATNLTLKLIFRSVHNAKDDVFVTKAKYYEGQETFYRGRAVLRIDTNQDGQVDLHEQVDIRSCRVLRR